MKMAQYIGQSEQIEKNVFFRRFSLLLLVLTFFLPTTDSLANQQTTSAGKIILLPFIVKTAELQEHLGDGLSSILATRMTEQTGLAAVHGKSTGFPEELLRRGEHGAAKKILQNMQGDYLVVSSLEQQESGYEIIIHVFSTKTAATSFSRKTPGQEGVISALNELALEIAEKVFHKTAFPEKTNTVANTGIMGGFQTDHPERAYIAGAYKTPETSESSNGAYKVVSSRSSGKITARIRGMDVADLDGNGREELVLLEQGNLALYRFGPDQFQHIADYPLPDYLGLHKIFLADLDSDRRSEVYIGASNGGIPASMVLAWNGSTFSTLHTNVPYYLRPDMDSAGKPILLGQTSSIQPMTFGQTTFSPLYRMTVNRAGQLDRAEEIQVPQGINIYDFIRADLDQDGSLEFIGVTPENELVVLDYTGSRTLWKSEETYGAGRDLVGTLAGNRAAAGNAPFAHKRTYIPTRIIAQDQTGDGRPEIIIGRNRMTNIKFFNSIRYFNGSSVAALQWDGSSLNTLWETRGISGYTVDYQTIRNAAQPNRLRLFFVESEDTGNPLNFWRSEDSIIHLYEMDGNSSAKNTVNR